MPYNNYSGQPRSNYGAPRNSAPRTSSFPPQSKTTGIRLTNERAGRFLDFNFWGRYSTLSISAVAAGSQITWDTIKNAQATQQNLAFGDLNELWDICSEVLETVKNTGTFTPIGMRIAGKTGDSIVEISNGSNLGLNPGIYLVIYKRLDSANRTNAIEYYPFNETRVLRGYDHNTGTAKEDLIKIGEFKKFYRAVQEAAKAFTMAQAHAAVTVSQNDKLAAFKAMAAITASMGIDISKELDAIAKGGSSSSRSGGGQQRQGASYGAPRSGGGSYGNAPRNPGTFEGGVAPMSASINDPVDITLSMDTLTNVDMSQFS